MSRNIELTLILEMLQPQSSPTALVFDQDINWTLFYKLVRRHRVWHQIHNALKNYPFDCPITSVLAKFCEADKRRILITAGETIRISRIFLTHAIEHCFVKGTLLNVHLYGGLNTRPCNDIDVWVSIDTCANAVTALLSLGYEKKLPYELKGFKERWYMRNKHDIAFYHPEKNMLIELHFRISSLWLDFFPLTKTPLKPISLLNVPVLAPEDDYHVLYLMVHGAKHGWVRLRWLQDIALYIKNNQCDLMHVYNLAKEINCQHIVEQALILVNNMFAIDNPVLTQLIQKPSSQAIQLAAIAQELIVGDSHHSYDIRNLNLFFKNRFYILKLAVHRQKLRALLSDLFKIDQLFVYVTFSDKLSFIYYVIYPPLWALKFAWKSIKPRHHP